MVVIIAYSAYTKFSRECNPTLVLVITLRDIAQTLVVTSPRHTTTYVLQHLS
jgi:hypothetical protein